MEFMGEAILCVGSIWELGGCVACSVDERGLRESMQDLFRVCVRCPGKPLLLVHTCCNWHSMLAPSPPPPFHTWLRQWRRLISGQEGPNPFTPQTPPGSKETLLRRTRKGSGVVAGRSSTLFNNMRGTILRQILMWPNLAPAPALTSPVSGILGKSE